MGLLDGLLKKAKEAVGEAIKDAIEEKISPRNTQAQVNTQPAPQEAPVQNESKPAPVVVQTPKPAEPKKEEFIMPDEPMSPEELRERIKAVIESDYPECQIQCNVPASYFDASAHEKAKPITLLIGKDGKNILAIAVVRFNTYRSYPVTGTKDAVEALGITYIRFFCEYENKINYISNRLAQYLK